jgi:CRP/FNR family cyclic AMP-dependent transcriptional regulator
MGDERATRQAALARLPLFGGLTAEELDTLAGSLRRRRSARGEVLFLAGDPGDSLYIIEAGRVKIALSSAQGKEVVLTILGPTDFFGDLALLDGEPRSADAITLEPCQLLQLRREDFLGFIDAHPAVAKKLLGVLSRRLRRNAQLLQDAAFHDVPGRLARLIVELVEREGRANGGAVVISSRLTQSDLAGMIGATRESVNKGLRSFERRGLLRAERGRIVVLDLAGLRGCIQ